MYWSTSNWYSNQFHLLLKKAETSYDNTSYKSNSSFVNHIATVMSQILCQLTAKMIRGLKSLSFADSELSECHKFESVGNSNLVLVLFGPQ